MANGVRFKALLDACLHSHHPVLRSQGEEDIVKLFLGQWEDYPSSPNWEQLLNEAREYENRSIEDILAILQRALTEGQEDDRVFALFLVGSLGTPEARNVLISFLHSENRKERWASALTLGRLKDERFFLSLQTSLLEGFTASDIFVSPEQLHAVQENGYYYRRAIEEKRRAKRPEALWRFSEYLEQIDYEWFIWQRSECALILGAWGNPAAIPALSQALQATWNMEQDWPNYEGPNESGPEIWYIFQDRLSFALGQLDAWDTLALVPLPELHLLVARIYMILGSIQINNRIIFDINYLHKLFHDHFIYRQERIEKAQAGLAFNPFIEPEQIKPLLGERFNLSATEQESYLERFHKAWSERAKESETFPIQEQ